MPEYIVIQRGPDGALDLKSVQKVTEPSSERAAAQFYNQCVVFPMSAGEVFPKDKPPEPWEQPSHVEGDDHDDLSSPARPA